MLLLLLQIVTKMLLRTFWIGKILIIYFVIFFYTFLCLRRLSGIRAYTYFFIVYRHFFCRSRQSGIRAYIFFL